MLLLAAMAATLLAASGVALAVNKVCPSGSTQTNSCSGTTGIDMLIGTSGVDYLKGLAGNDNTSGRAGNDTTDGGGGSDTYSYKDGWGQDTRIDSGGSADRLNFSVMGQNGGVHVQGSTEGGNCAQGPNGKHVKLPGTPVLEEIAGSSGFDDIRTGPGVNTLQPGPGTGRASLEDWGGCLSNWCTPASWRPATPTPAWLPAVTA